MKEGGQLCEAARNGDAVKTRALIDSGGDVTYFGSDGLTPLMHAAKLGHADVVKILLSAGAPLECSFSLQCLRRRLCYGGRSPGAVRGPPQCRQAELVLVQMRGKGSNNGNSGHDNLEDRVSFSEDKLMDSDNEAVMMDWEKPLMEAHAKAICSGGGHTLNVGFGMGQKREFNVLPIRFLTCDR